MTDELRGEPLAGQRAADSESTRICAPTREAASILTKPVAIASVAVSFLVLRGIAWFQYDPVTFDSALYFEMAALIQSGRWAEALAYDYPPLYAILIAALQTVAGAADTAGLLIAFTADLFILLPIVGITRRAAGENAAWAAALLWVVHPSAIRLAVQALSDAPTALCVAVALYAGLRAFEEHRLVWALGAGMASGLAFLFRPEGLEPAVALAAFYAFQWHRPAREPADAGKASLSVRHAFGSHEPAPSSRAPRAIRRAVWALAPLVGWVLVAGPYVAQISVESGSLTLSKKKSAASLVRSVVPLRAPESSGSRAADRGARTELREERKQARAAGPGWLRGFGQSTYFFQRPLVNGLNPLLMVLWCVGLTGILGRRAERWNRTQGLLTGLFVLHLGILIGLAVDKGATYLGRHHFLLMVVYAMPVAGVGMVYTLAWLGDRLRGRRWVPAAALALIVVATGLSLVTRGPDQGRSLRSAATWIRSQVAGTPVIVTSLAKLTYHARAERVDIGGTYDEILRRARDHGAHFVALYPDLIKGTSPDFLTHLGSGDLDLVKIFPEPSPSAPEQRLELYRLRPMASRAPKGS